MSDYFHPKFPDSNSLRIQAKKRMPAFAFEYLEGGCIDENGLQRNANELQDVRLRSQLLTPSVTPDTSVELFGETYAAPFGVAPVGLQGLMWPNAPEILAKAAAKQNIPYVLSTVSSSSLERIAEVSEGKAWFQLYNPTDDATREDLLKRIKAAGYKNIMVTVDVPTFGYRVNDIKNGLSMPPKMNLKNIIEMVKNPAWLLATARAGEPQMETLKPYMPPGMPADQLASFMNNTVMGPVDADALQMLRDKWDGNLIIKGVVNADDVARAVSIGADGVVLSNHGARQLDCGESSITGLQQLQGQYKDKIKLLFDSGVRSGTDVAAAMASGADFTFLGRTFVYAVAALGEKGGEHAINMLLKQYIQVMSQLKCARSDDLPNFLAK
jgi:isopentenyl diphosphate isomerase/L-lactate dehydrogenase-like FMN-dependent dehydrogenase